MPNLNTTNRLTLTQIPWNERKDKAVYLKTTVANQVHTFKHVQEARDLAEKLGYNGIKIT